MHRLYDAGIIMFCVFCLLILFTAAKVMFFQTFIKQKYSECGC